MFSRVFSLGFWVLEKSGIIFRKKRYRRDLSDDGIHTPVIQVETTQSLPGLVSVGASRSLEDGQNSEHTPCIWTGHDALVVVQAGHWRKIGSHAYT